MKTMNWLVFDKKTEEQLPSHVIEVDNVERDNAEYVTAYGKEIDGLCRYAVFSQDLIRELNQAINPMDTPNKLYDLLWQIRDERKLEAHREYGTADLVKMYSLTDQEGEDLYWLIESQFNEEKDFTPLENLTHNQIISYIEDARHSNWDGWDSEHDKIVIERFLMDLRLGAKHYGGMNDKGE